LLSEGAEIVGELGTFGALLEMVGESESAFAGNLAVEVSHYLLGLDSM
jgi:hypothetical protein